MPLLLEVLTGSRTGHAEPLPAGKSVYVGKHMTAHVVIDDDDRVADTHFALVSDGREWRIRDMGSRAGTFVNGTKVQQRTVRAGDRIDAGDTSFLLRETGAADATAAPAEPAAVAARPAPESTPPQEGAPVSPAPVGAASEGPPAVQPVFPTHSAKLLEVHWEELGFLWGQRQRMLKSPRNHLYDLANLEDRIAAHVQGLLAVGEPALSLLRPGLEGDEPAEVAAAAYVLLEGRREAVVMQAFGPAQGARLSALTEALSLSERPANAALLTLANGNVAAPAAAAAQALACRRAAELKSWPADRFLVHEDPRVRQAAWRAVALGASCAPERFAAGLADAEAAVRQQALYAAAWTGAPQVLPHCRACADKPAPEGLDALHLLAVLAGPEDLLRVQAVGQMERLGPSRFKVLGALGHPTLMETILQGIESPDPRTAVAAAAAFRKITGVDVSSNRRAKLPPEDGHAPDDFEKEFLEEVELPDPARARAQWSSLQSSYAKGTRWGHGQELTRAVEPSQFATLDLESRWEAHLRSRFVGSWNGTAGQLEEFLQQA